MAITVEQRTSIIELVVGMFGAAPGASVLSDLVAAYEAGQSLNQIAANLANTNEFKGIFPTFLTNAEFATKVVNQLVGSEVVQAEKDAAITTVTGLLNGGQSRSSVFVDAIAAVNAITSTNTAWANAGAAFDNKVAVAVYYSVDKQLSGSSLSALQNVIANVTSAASTVTTAKATADGTSATGVNFTLTSGVDIFNGAAGNDTFIADNSNATKQLTVADQLVGGAGVDTLKIYLAAADTATGQPSITDIEEIYINGGAMTAYTAPTGSTKLSIDGASANVVATYTVATKELSLANKTSTAATTTTISTTGATSHTTTLNAITRDLAANATTLDYSTASLATLNLVAATASSNIALTNTGAGITALNVSGNGSNAGLTITAAPAAIVNVNASGLTGTGGLAYTAGTAGATFKFTGGGGNDTVSFADNGFAALTAGTQLNGGAGTGDKIGILDIALTGAETAILNAATGFEVLGLNAGITLDASTLTSIKSFSVDTAALTLTINTLATGSTVSTSLATTSLTLGTAVGVTDVGITLGDATTGAFTVGTLVVTGITNVSITSNGTAAKTITTLTNSDNSNFTVKGAGGLTATLSAGTAVGSKIDGSAATGILTLSGSTIVGSGDILIGGSGADVLDGLSGTDKLTGGAGADIFKFTSATNANANGATFGTFDEITDFQVGVDKLQFTTADVVSAQQGAVQNAVTALASGSTAAQIATAMATANTTNLGVSFAVFGGNTYVLYEEAGASTGDVTDDVFIKLTGVTTLPTFAVDVTA